MVGRLLSLRDHTGFVCCVRGYIFINDQSHPELSSTPFTFRALGSTCHSTTVCGLRSSLLPSRSHYHRDRDVARIAASAFCAACSASPPAFCVSLSTSSSDFNPIDMRSAIRLAVEGFIDSLSTFARTLAHCEADDGAGVTMSTSTICNVANMQSRSLERQRNNGLPERHTDLSRIL